ncbi:MAG: septum formation initiator family protein [Candidatus Auribacterota bacterium]|nr:septum formation initiator family protein [Candidatus Auribacterota bacterium]
MSSQKKPWKAIGFTILIVILCVLGTYFVLPGFLRINAMSRKEEQLQYLLKQKENEKALLEKEHEKLKNDPVAAEKVARDEMGMSKDNEVIYKFDR